jgi:Desulfoferrodoxin, N-terminal domain
MPRPKKGTEYVCGVCGTTLLVTDEGVGLLEDVVCCEKPMKTRAKKAKESSKPKRKK